MLDYRERYQMTLARQAWLVLVMFVLTLTPSSAFAAAFDEEELVIAPSPAESRELVLGEGDQIIDFSVSGNAPIVYFLLGRKNGAFSVRTWNITDGDGTTNIERELDYVPAAIACHPARNWYFVAGQKRSDYFIRCYRPDAPPSGFDQVYQTKKLPIRNLLVGPRPFETEWLEEQRKPVVEYRLFFGLPNQVDQTPPSSNRGSAIRTITEKGRREYQVIGLEQNYVVPPNSEMPLKKWIAPSALPIDFHPAGDTLVWQDEGGSFHYLRYAQSDWESAGQVLPGELKGGTLRCSPNGLGFAYWRDCVPGVVYYQQGKRFPQPLAASVSFQRAPRWTPDGKGLVGPILRGKRPGFVYQPTDLPLHDVANAWMFLSDAAVERPLLSTNRGFFRPVDGNQLYDLYEREGYLGSYDNRYPMRPYFVTTDVFWELLGAAFEGVFIIEERSISMPAFREFVESANAHFQKRKADSSQAAVFRTLDAYVKGGKTTDSEAVLIDQAAGESHSKALKRRIDYGRLRPVGHYAGDPELGRYFKAFTYLTTLAAADETWLSGLKDLPAEVTAKAERWIAGYEFFVSAPRRPVVWRESGFTPPRYERHTAPGAQLFPFSWGFDNEVLNSTVYHESWPAEEQITGPEGFRLVPSALDFAAVLDSRLAESLLADQFQRFPRLQVVVNDLRKRFTEARANHEFENRLYDRWIQALAIQWSEEALASQEIIDPTLWKVKRLQTGLASWTTLRHATALVNEIAAAEAGEGGFENIVMKPPRGFVEPDPGTFDAIADLFDLVSRHVETHWKDLTKTINHYDQPEDPVQKGVLRRLRESADKARKFKEMAAKELEKKPLSAADYEEILSIGRTAEHHFLVYKSLAGTRCDYGLTIPTPMPKTVAVAGGVGGGAPRGTPYLQCSVGRPLEWDQIVPYFGRRQLVRGAIYSYYETKSAHTLTDQDWLKMIPGQDRPSWVGAYVPATLPPLGPIEPSSRCLAGPNPPTDSPVGQTSAGADSPSHD